MVTKDYYSLSEAAEVLGKSKETLRRWDRDGKLDAVREPVSNYRVYRKGVYSRATRYFTIIQSHLHLVDKLETMFTLSSSHRFHLYSQPTDMRKSFDGLSGLVKNILERDPFHGDVFIFINKRRDKIKLLHWQGVSFSLYYKRLEKGTFELPQYDAAVKSIALSYTQMVMIVDGLTVSNIHKRKQYQPAVSN